MDVHHGVTETLRKKKAQGKTESTEVAEATEGDSGEMVGSGAQRMFTTESRRHGEREKQKAN
jgi:hypothetical protein